MKKLFMLLAIAGVMVACADDKKKEAEKAAENIQAAGQAAAENIQAAGQAAAANMQDYAGDFE